LILFAQFLVVLAHFLLLTHIQTAAEILGEVINQRLLYSLLNGSQVEIFPDVLNRIVEELKEKLRAIDGSLNYHIYISIESL